MDNVALFEGPERSNIEQAVAYDITLEGWSRVGFAGHGNRRPL